MKVSNWSARQNFNTFGGYYDFNMYMYMTHKWILKLHFVPFMKIQRKELRFWIWCTFLSVCPYFNKNALYCLYAYVITNSTFLHMKTMKLKALFCLPYNQVPVHIDGAISVNLRSKYMLDQWHVFFFGAVGSFQGRWYNVCLINRFLVCLVGALTFKVIVYSFAQKVYHRVIRILSCSKSSSEYRNLSYIRACATYIQK